MTNDLCNIVNKKYWHTLLPIPRDKNWFYNPKNNNRINRQNPHKQHQPLPKISHKIINQLWNTWHIFQCWLEEVESELAVIQ
jgi:hypothetical protein